MSSAVSPSLEFGRGTSSGKQAHAAQGAKPKLEQSREQVSEPGWLPRHLTSAEARDSLVNALFEASPAMMLVLGADGRIAGANTQALRAYGYERQALEGKPLDLLLPAASRERLAEHLAGSLESRAAQQHASLSVSSHAASANPAVADNRPEQPVGMCINLLTRHASGSEFAVDVTLRPFTADGAQYVIVVCRPVDSASGRSTPQVEEAAQVAAELEKRVAERTSELASTVEELKSKNEEIEALVAMVTHDLSEKEVLLREVYHRVKNNLQVVQSLLKMGSRTVPSNDARLAIDTAVQRVHVMAMVHEHLYQMPDLAGLTLESYLRDVVEGSIASNSERPERIKLHLETDEIPVPLDFAIPLGLLANELVSNCLKHGLAHGRPGKISISARKIPGSMRLVVEDDGVGLPEGFDATRTTSMGLKLASSLARQLGGQLSFSSINGCRVEADLARLHTPADAGPPIPELGIPMRAAALNQRRKAAGARTLAREFSDPSRFLS